MPTVEEFMRGANDRIQEEKKKKNNGRPTVEEFMAEGKQSASPSAHSIREIPTAMLTGQSDRGAAMQGVYQQLGKTGWADWQKDPQYRRELGLEMIRTQQAMKGYDDKTADFDAWWQHEQQQHYLSGLRDLEDAYQQRQDWFGQFKDENEYGYFTDIEPSLEDAHQRGLTNRQWHDEIESGYQTAQKDIEELSADIETLEAEIPRLEEELRVNGQYYGPEWEQDLERKRQQLETEKARLEQAYEDARKYGYQRMISSGLKYSDLPEAEDWESGVDAGRAAYETLQASVEADRAQRAAEVRQGNTEVAGLSEEELAGEDYWTYRMPRDGWTEDELNTYYYLLNRDEEEAAQHAIETNQRHMQQQRYAKQSETQDWAHDNLVLGAAGGTVSSILTSPMALWDWLGDLVQYGNTGLVMPRAELSPRDYANMLSAGAAAGLNDRFGTLPEDWAIIGGKGWGDAYQLGNSVLESMAWGGLTKAMVAAGAPEWLGAAVTNMGFFGSAASETTQNAIVRGASPEQALWLGAAAGAAEALGETFSVEKLIHITDTGTMRRLLWNTLKQGGIEASEEAFTTLINTVADAWIMGDKSEYNEKVRQNILAGMTREEAEKAAWQDWAEGIAQDALGGFISGGVSGGVYGSANMIQGSRTEYSGTDRQALLDAALQMDPKGKAYQLAQKIQQQGTMSYNEALQLKDLMGERAELVSWDVSDRERAEIQQRAESALKDAGVENPGAAAQLIAKEVMGEELSRDERRVLRGVQQAEQVSRELRQARNIEANLRHEAAQRQRKELREQKKGGNKSETRSFTTSASVGTAEKDSAVTVKGQEGEAKLEGLVRGEDGSLKAKVTDGAGETRTVELDALDYGESGLNELVQELRGQQDAPVMFQAYSSGMGIGTFINGWNVAKAYGRNTSRSSAESIMGDGLLEGVDPNVIRMAFDHGRRLQQKERAQREKEQKEKRIATPPTEARNDSEGGERAAEGVGPYEKGEEKSKGGVSYEGGTVDGVKLKAVNQSRLNPRQRAQIEAVDMLGKTLSVRFVLFESDLKSRSGVYANGMYKDGVIYLDVNAGRHGQSLSQVAMVRTAAHELTHYMQDFAEERYEELKQFLLDHLIEWKGKDLGELSAQKLQRDRTGKLTMEDALDEVVADGCEMMLRRTKVMQTMAAENKGLFRTVKNWLQKWLGTIKEAFLGVSEVHEEARAVAEMEAERLEKLVKLWDKGLLEAAENAAKGPAKTGGAVKYSFAGERAETADLEKLQAAQEMEKQGIDAERIRQETGWFRGMDNKWRFEIDDSKAKYEAAGDVQFREDHPSYDEFRILLDKLLNDPEGLTKDDEKRLRTFDATWGGEMTRLSERVKRGNATLGDIFRHDELFRSYPELKGVRVEFANLPIGMRGELVARSGLIRLDNSLRMNPVPTLLHEIQHAIQHIEEFSTGASPEYWNSRRPDRSSAELYEKTAGEIEARDTASRRKLTAEERKNTRPDIDRRDVVFAESGTEESIGYTKDNKAVVIIDADILDGVPKNQWRKTVTDNLKSKFPSGILVGNSEIYIDRQSRKEITSSGYSKWLSFNYPDIYAEKLRASNNADELLRASHDWVNEQPSHNRKDGISDFARGRVLIRIGSNKYSADVLVGKGKNGKLKLYDLLDINKTTFTEKETEYATALDPSPGSHRNTYPISDSSILSSSEKSNTKFQERDALPDDRALLMTVKAEGRNAEALTAYQKKVKSLEALERKLQRQQAALEEAKKRGKDPSASLRSAQDDSTPSVTAASRRDSSPEGGAKSDQGSQDARALRKAAVEGWQEKIRKTEAQIWRAEKALDDMERSPQLRQETEKALAAWREANPQEAAKAIREMQQERESLKKYVELLRQEAKLTTPETRRMLPSDVRKLAQALVKEHGSSAAVDSITEKLQELGDFMVSNMEGGDVSYYNHLVAEARKIAKEIVNESYETIDDNKEIREGIRHYLRERTLNSEELRGDIPDFERWRKSHMGTLRLGKDGMSIDQAYQDLRSEYGEGLFPADVMAASDQIQQILDALDIVQPSYQQMFSEYESWQVAEALGNEIVDRLLSGEVRERESMADKAFRQRMKQLEEKYARKDKARQQALNDAEDQMKWERAKRDEAEERRREERALRRQLVSEKVHELRERSIERDKKYRARIAIDKKVVSLSKIMLENSGKRHVPDAWKESIGGFLASIDTLSQHSGEKSRSFHLERILALQKMVAGQQARNKGEEGKDSNNKDGKSKDKGVFFLINPMIEEMLEPFVKTALDSDTGTITVENLELSQMQELEEILVTLREAVDKADVMLADRERGKISENAGAFVDYAEARGKGKTGGMMRRFLSWDNLTPVYFFRRFGEAGEKVFRGLQRGWGKLAFNAQQIIDFSTKTYSAKEAKAWERETHEFRLVKRESDMSGRESLSKAAAEGGPEAVKAAEEKNKTTVTLSTAQIMGLYCLSKREQALGHILSGGIRIWDISAKKGTVEQAERYLVSAEDLATITGSLTQRQKEVADALQKYMNTVGSAWGNEVSKARFGVDLFTEKNYYPIQTDDKSRNAKNPEADGTDLFHILNMGFTKNTVKNAKNGVVIHSIFDVFANHMADMAKYNAMGLPMLDAMKWFNYRDESDGRFVSVRASMEKAYGKNAERYFLGFMQDLNGSFEGGRRGEDIASRMISHAKVASVGANLRVAALQPTSYVRALAVLDPKYLLKGDNLFKVKQGMKEALQYSGTAVWKDLGFFDMNINANMRDLIKHTDGKIEKIRELSMAGAEFGDKTTWGRIWNATKAEVREKTGLSGEELLQATAERFDDVIYRTQVMDSTMTRSHLMRQKGVFASMATSFMSEPTLSYNLVLDAVTHWQDAKLRKAGVREAGKLAARAFATYALSQIAASIVESFFSALRDDDDYEDLWEKWKQAEFGWDGNLVQDLVLHNKLPFVRDVVSILEGFSNKRMDTEWVEDLVSAYKALKRDIETGEFRWGTAYACMNALSTMTGLPISNAARDGVALWNSIVVQSVPDWKLKNIKRGTVKPEAGVKQAYLAGALSEEDAIRYLMRDAGIESEEKARQKLYEWSLSKDEKTYTKLLNAVRAGDSSAATQALETLRGSGYSESMIYSAVRSAVKEWYQGTGEDELPRMNKQKAIDTLVQYGGMRRREAEERVQEWTSYVSSPEKLQYEEIQEAYVNGEISAERAAEMRVLFGGERQAAAEAEVNKWRCERETGFKYEELDDAYLEGEITMEEAVEYRIRYGDQKRVDAEAEVNRWRCEKETGIRYSEIRDAYLEKQITGTQARNMLMKYGGKDEDDAEGILLQYDFAGRNPELQDISAKAATDYYVYLSSGGISKETWYYAWKAMNGMESNKDANGKTVQGSLKNKKISYIDSLNLTPAQKDLLYLTQYPKGEKDLNKTPWHK